MGFAGCRSTHPTDYRRSSTGGGPVASIGREVGAVIVGAGFAGLYMLYRLRGLGLSACVFEAGDGIGGTWLEPLSRRALRRRKHGLLVLVFGRAPAGMALERALRVA